MLIRTPFFDPNPLRDNITKAYRMDEAECLEQLISQATFSEHDRDAIQALAKQLVNETRAYKKRQGKIDSLLHQYDLSTDEGVALMCLAEALLRIPDKATMDKFISDKLSTVEWGQHLAKENSLFVNAATWSLLLTGKMYAPTISEEKNLLSSLKRATSRLGISVIRPIILQMMKLIGKQFVLGENIESALKRSEELIKLGYSFSYDMLGEAARTQEDAENYYQSYVNAIDAIGKTARSNDPAQNPGISVKLSALHPRYEYTQRERVLTELTPRLLALAQLAKKYNLGFTVDAEEADRLDLSLDIFEKVFTDPSLAGWEGFGLAVQAYQKRASYVLDWLLNLAQQHHKRMMVRLVKGAYWDAEIKWTQQQGFVDYPVFTRKAATDISYLACAKKLLAHTDYFYPQFGTHNAYSVAAIMQAASNKQFEFQCLHGMGRPLYDQIVTQFNYPTRIYAPVGTHRDLLGYLVRRLLENGANTSFINLIASDDTPIEKLIADPVAYINALPQKRHPRIPLPKDIYVHWQNSRGIDLSNSHELMQLKKAMDKLSAQTWHAEPLSSHRKMGSSVFKNSLDPSLPPAFAGAKGWDDTTPIYSPIDHSIIGSVTESNDEIINAALTNAFTARENWRDTPINERAQILEKAADLLQAQMSKFVTLLTLEGGKQILDCVSETREAIDYCRYYAYRAREDLKTVVLPGPTGEFNSLSLQPRGVIVCISPWNFPLAIFMGQIVAALVTGNTVIAKPAEQTPLIAYQAIQLLYEAGIPKNVLHLLPGDGQVGAKLVSDERIAGVMFTGSTETAKRIEQSLANRKGPTAMLIAETGGQNAMIVDSSALCEQVVLDVVQSSFNSAGQRCSASRVLFVQEEMAPRLLSMLTGYMAELNVGNPSLLATDVGPVIDKDAYEMLKKHAQEMRHQSQLLAEVSAPATGLYFGPRAVEMSDLSILQKEIFGPFLHIIRYKANELDKVIAAIINTGYGLTLGIHSRIDATIRYIVKRLPVGNIYVNRNMIGAVVGVQPFGGEQLSGTGPKAGGPHYLTRLCVERALSNNITAVGGNARLISLLEED